MATKARRLVLTGLLALALALGPAGMLGTLRGTDGWFTRHETGNPLALSYHVVVDDEGFAATR